MGGGGNNTQPAGNTTTVQNSAPWTAQQPFLEQGFGQAQNLFQNYTPQYFPNSTVAPLTGQQQQAIGNETTFGQTGNPAVNQAANFLTGSLSGDYLNSNPGSAVDARLANTNPDAFNPANPAASLYSSGAMLGAGNPYFQQMAQNVEAQVQPSLEGQFAQGNGMNGSNGQFAIANGLSNAIGALANQDYLQGQQNQLAGAGLLGQNFNQGLQAQEGAAGLLGQNYNTALNQATQSALLAPQNQQAEVQQIAALSDAGSQLQQQNQAQINDAIARWNFGQQLPYNQLGAFDSFINGNYGGTSTLTQPYFLPQSGGLLGGLGGALAGSAIGSNFGSYGAPIGAIAGGLLGGIA